MASQSDDERDAKTPYWRLIAVLASSFPMQPPLAMRLYRAALALHESDGDVERITGDLGEGQVRRLGREVVLGSYSGPAFEAEIETEAGRGQVRFLVTREGLDTGEAQRKTEETLRGGPRSSMPN